jgi:hypothetical protein
VEGLRAQLRAQEARTEAAGRRARVWALGRRCASITVPYADVRAADLTLELGLARVPALEVLRVPLGPGLLELRLLGHSHQARAELPGAAFSETVRCAPGARGGLPASSTDAAGPLVLRLHRRRRAARPARARRRSRRGSPPIRAGSWASSAPIPAPSRPCAPRRRPPGGAAGGLAWETWHAYPQSGELVRTRAEVRPA